MTKRRARSGTRATKQHYLPACLLGRFSDRDRGEPRKRPIWVFDTRAAKAIQCSADAAGFVKGLYDLVGSDQTVDDAWGYETRLSIALDAVVDPAEPLNGLVWATVLVPFVAGLFARPAHFASEFVSRFPQEMAAMAGSAAEPDNVTEARLQDLQRTLAPLLTSQWSVVHFPAGTDLITSDVGYTLTRVPRGVLVSQGATAGILSYVIPISTTEALVISPAARRTALTSGPDGWVTPVSHHYFPVGGAAGLSESVASYARHSVFGPSTSAVESVADRIGQASGPGLALLDAMEIDGEAHLYDWFRLVRAISSRTTNRQDAADAIDWSLVSKELWPGPIVVELLFPERTAGGVRASDHEVTVDLAWGRSIRRASPDRS